MTYCYNYRSVLDTTRSIEVHSWIRPRAKWTPQFTNPNQTHHDHRHSLGRNYIYTAPFGITLTTWTTLSFIDVYTLKEAKLLKEYSIEFLFIISNSDLTEVSLKVGGKSSLELVHSTSVLQALIIQPILLNKIIFITWCMVDCID